MSNAKPPMPPQPTTKQLPRVMVPSDTVDTLVGEIRAVRAVQTGQIELLQKLTDQVTALTDHYDSLSARMKSVEHDGYARGAKHSGGLRQLSEADAKHDANFANLFSQVDAVKGQVADVNTRVEAVSRALVQNNVWTKEIVDAGRGFFRTHPQVTASLVTLIVAAIAWATSWLSAKGH